MDNRTAKQAWESLGDWWDEQLGDGDFFHNKLIFPHLLKVIEPQKNDSILDLACENGALARLLANYGCSVVAVDFCQSFLNKAVKRTKECNLHIVYYQVDLTKKDQIKSKLSGQKFNKTVCSLAIHAIANIKPLVEILPIVLNT